MANIIAYTRKELEKGNTLIDKKGNFTSEEKVTTKLRKAYIDGLKNGSVAFDTNFNDYASNEIDQCYIKTSDFLAGLEQDNGFELDCMPVACEETKESIVQ